MNHTYRYVSTHFRSLLEGTLLSTVEDSVDNNREVLGAGDGGGSASDSGSHGLVLLENQQVRKDIRRIRSDEQEDG